MTFIFSGNKIINHVFTMDQLLTLSLCSSKMVRTTKKQKIAKSHRFMDLLKAALKKKNAHFQPVSCFMRPVARGCRGKKNLYAFTLSTHTYINFIRLLCPWKCVFTASTSISLQPNNQMRKLGSKDTLYHCGANRSHHHKPSQSAHWILYSKQDFIYCCKVCEAKTNRKFSHIVSIPQWKMCFNNEGFGLLWPLFKV